SDILLNGQTAKNRGFLRQITDPEASAAIHRQFCYVLAVQLYRASIGRNQAGDDVKAGGLAGAVRTQQPDHLAALNRDADIAQHRAALEALAKPIADQATIVGDQPRCALPEPGGPGVARRAASHAAAHHGFLSVAEEGLCPNAPPAPVPRASSSRMKRP